MTEEDIAVRFLFLGEFLFLFLDCSSGVLTSSLFNVHTLDHCCAAHLSIPIPRAVVTWEAELVS